MNVPPTTIYLGLDLAWSERNPSGLAAACGTPSGARLIVRPHRLKTTAEIVAIIRAICGDAPAILAIDAPLLVPNETGQRLAEAELAAAFRQYHAGPHPANRQLLRRYGGLRGEEIIAALASDGFCYTPTIESGGGGRLIVEVFPHPATIVLFGLPRILQYKARQGRSLVSRRHELRRYLDLLGSLIHADPPLIGVDRIWEKVDLSDTGATALKAIEDEADAVLCAYIALYGHRWGAARCRSFGTVDGGAIFTPYWYEQKTPAAPINQG
jgi:predicted RNase H-like nuclease